MKFTLEPEMLFRIIRATFYLHYLPYYRLLDSMKMPGQARSGFHICDILDLNDAKVHVDPSVNLGNSTTIPGIYLPNFFLEP